MHQTHFDPQPWMTAPATVAVMRALAEGGAVARFVGGCVRDAVAGRPVADIDIATEAEPGRVMELLAAAGLKVVPTGLAHGTVTAVSGGKPYAITTLRRDVETDGRRAVVAFTDDWVADASRRDFTMNALSLDADGVMHDPFGGVDDLRAGRVRFVGDARQRIAEDVLRLLRYFRFHAHYGRPPPDEEALAACRGMAHLLVRLSAERVRTEVLKLLAAQDPAPVLRLMRDEGVLGHFLAQATGIDRMARLVSIEAQLRRVDPLRRLAALLPVDAQTAGHLARGLRLSNRERDRLVAIAAPALALTPDLDAAGRRRALYALGAETYCDLALVAWADAAAAPDDPAWRGLVEAAQGWVRPDLPVNGGDARRLGVEQGEAVGVALRSVEAWWIDGDFRADRRACLDRLAELARG